MQCNTPSTSMHHAAAAAAALLSLETVGGKFLAAWQQNKWKKGLGVSYFPDDLLHQK